MKKLLLIDGNSIVNRAFYAMPNLTSSQGICTGGIFGFLKMLSKVIKEERPTNIGVAFDLKAPTFRHLEYKEYKAGRRAMPEELVQQIPILKDLLQKMNIATFEKEGFEADDILGTLSKDFNGECIIVSGDKDILQLVDERCTVFHTKKGISDVVKYTPELLKEEGIANPEYVTDLKGLMGDSSDNLKGVPGVGKVTATSLIAEYGNLDNLYSHIEEIKGKLKEKLIEGKDDAYKSKHLATIVRNVPIDTSESVTAFSGIIGSEAYTKMVELDFKNIDSMFSFEKVEVVNQKTVAEIVVITNEDELQTALRKANDTKKLCFNLDGQISFTVDGKTEYIIREQESLLDITIPQEVVYQNIVNYLNNSDIQKTVFDLKNNYYILKEFIEPFEANDLLLMSYVADVSKHKTVLKDLLESYGKNTEAPCVAMLELFEELKAKTIKENSYSIYKDIEMPLVGVLFDMETTGFRVDVKMLDDLNVGYTERISTLEESIYEIAGEKFNINSPKQLGEVLFDKLALPSGKKKSTNADVLEKLYHLNPIVPLILEYRKIAKLQSTYIVGMKKLLDKNDRLHTIFKQALTTTGRLSSTEPNLQNIPVRTAEGKEIRKAFIASENNRLVVADYSQIELRLMAHMSEDEQMISDFNSSKDIHASTASVVFGVKLDEVTKDMRRKAKAVNFGIIYGISDFGLSEDVGCSIGEARNFIKKYFEGYPKVKEYMDNTVASAKEKGYVETLFGRRRVIPELNSSVYTVRSFGERAAMNMPLQGTASDIIKLAMIEVHKKLMNVKNAKLILQVHDELIIDCPKDRVDEVAKIIKETMENVFTLKVPLIAEVGVGENWIEAKD